MFDRLGDDGTELLCSLALLQLLVLMDYIGNCLRLTVCPSTSSGRSPEAQWTYVSCQPVSQRLEGGLDLAFLLLFPISLTIVPSGSPASWNLCIISLFRKFSIHSCPSYNVGPLFLPCGLPCFPYLYQPQA